MGRLRWLFLLSLMVACDGTTTGGEDSDALVPDGTADLGEVDLDATSSDAASTFDASLEPDTSAELDATPVPDVGQVERCGPLGRCTANGGWCEPADHPECWRGEAPACFDEFHPLSRANCADMMSTGSPAACECPPGLESAPGEDVCVAVTNAAQVVRHVNPSHDEVLPFGELVHVVPIADTKAHSSDKYSSRSSN